MSKRPPDPKENPTFQKVVQKFLTTKPQPKKAAKAKKRAKPPAPPS
jgi:hypothetical protein